MLQKVRPSYHDPYHPQDINTYYDEPEDSPLLIHPDGSEEQLALPSGSAYHCILTFHGALEPLSTKELAEFSSSVATFASLNCDVVGLSRDSAHVIREWFIDLGESAKVSVASCRGLKSGGLIQGMGVPLVDGYPIPSILITDRCVYSATTLVREDKVRFFATYRPDTARSAEEALRVVAAIKEVDAARGGLLTPAAWVQALQGEPSIQNTKAGVAEYNQRRHEGEGEEEYVKGSRLTGLRRTLQQLYEGVFGGSTSMDTDDRRRLEDAVVDEQEEAATSETRGGEEEMPGRAGERIGVINTKSMEEGENMK